MRQIPLAALTPGMVTAVDILSYDQETIVPKGIILTENIISRLEGYSIYYVQIEDNLITEPPAEGLHRDNPSQHFSQSFVRCAEHYRNNLMKSLYRHEQFRTDELLKETMALLPKGRQDVSVLDRIRNSPETDNSVYSHCIRVALISNILACWLDFSEAEQAMAAACGLFHDIGKLMLPAGILRNSAKLKSSESEIMKTHTIEGFHLLGRCNSILDPVKNTALMHHERCDGSGYPYGLSGEDIDKYSRLVTIADTFDNISSGRMHPAALCPLSIIKYFEDDGIQKYESNYILTFLEHIANSCFNHSVTLSSGMNGNVIFIRPNTFLHPADAPADSAHSDPQFLHYKNMLQLSNQKNLFIESVLL